jgi:hypothetical protein
MRTRTSLRHASLCLAFFGWTLAHAQTTAIVLSTHSSAAGQANSPMINNTVQAYSTRVTGTGSLQTQGMEFAGAGPTAGMGGSYQSTVDAANQVINSTASATGELVGSVYVYPSAASATTQLRYDFEVVGPSDVVVPLVVLTPHPLLNGFTTGYAQTYGDAKLQVQSYNVYAGYNTNYYYQNFGSLEETSYSDPGNPLQATSYDTFKASEKFKVTSNWNYNEITMTTQAVVSGGAQDNPPYFTPVIAQMSVTLDPIIEIDPSFADASQYQIVFSTNVHNAVPEPASFAALGLGVAFVVRRKKKGIR